MEHKTVGEALEERKWRAEGGHIYMLIRREAKRLRVLYSRTGEEKFLNAAEALHSTAQPGRSSHNDEPNLFLMGALIKEGYAANPHAAAKLVCEDAKGHSEEATIKRLERKFRGNVDRYKKSSGLSGVLVHENSKLAALLSKAKDGT